MAAKKKPLTAGRISKLAADPGTRAALADKYLNPAQLQQRQLNKRLNAPVTSGSSLTNRDLAHQSKAAAILHFGGDPVGQAQQVQKDTGDWYAQYQAAANQLKTDLGNNATQATTAAQNLTGAVGQLGSDTAAGQGAVRDDALKASAVRQALSGGFGTMLAAQGQNSKDYGAKIADLVVPGQKLTAQNRAAGGVRDAKGLLAAFLEKYKADAVTGEQKAATDQAKMDLAMQTLGLDASKATNAQKNASANIDIRRGVDPVTGKKIQKPKTASEQKTAADLAYFKQHGYYPPTGAPKKPKGTDAKSPYLGTPGQNSFKNDLASTKTTVGNLHDQYSRNELRRLLQTGRAAQTVYVDANGKVLPNVTDLTTAHKQGGHAIKVPAIPKVSNDAALSAALDAVYDGHLSAATIKKLHAAGIKANGLGISTKAPKAPKASQVSSTMTSVGALLGGLGK